MATQEGSPAAASNDAEMQHLVTLAQYLKDVNMQSVQLLETDALKNVVGRMAETTVAMVTAIERTRRVVEVANDKLVNQVTTINGVHTSIAQGHAQVLQQLKDSQSTMGQAVTQMLTNMGNSGAGGNRHNDGYRKGVLDNKAIVNLKALDSDKGTFRDWNEKLINAMGQSMTGSRSVMEWLTKQINEGTEIQEDRYEEQWTNQWGQLGVLQWGHVQ